jgi:serine/threonine-protein kinase
MRSHAPLVVTSVIPDRYELGERYSLHDMLGEGAMGRVYAARDTFLGREVALKIPFRKRENESTRHVIDEARASARLESEHVARILDAGKTRDGDLPYIVMEKLDGVDLAHLVGTPLPIATVVDYIAQACEGIAEAHALGMVHRDIKPSNLFLAQRRDGTSVIKVLDFGVAVFGAAGKPRETDPVGTPQYMAPEVLLGERVDARADVWSLGVVLFELLVGRLPFDGDGPHAVWAAVLRNEIPRVDSIRAEVPASLADVVARCLERNTNRRFADAGEVGRTLASMGRRRAPARVIAATLAFALRASTALRTR